MRHLTIILSLLFFTSCSKDYFVNKYCPKIKDSTHVEVIRHDSTIITEIRDTVPADTLKMLIKVPCADFEIVKENKRQKVTIKVKDGVLVEEAICKEWEFKYFVSKTVSTLTEKTFHQEVRLISEKVKKTFWHWLGYWESWLCIAFVFMFLLFKIFRLLGLKPVFTLLPPFISMTK